MFSRNKGCPSYPGFCSDGGEIIPLARWIVTVILFILMRMTSSWQFLVAVLATTKEQLYGRQQHCNHNIGAVVHLPDEPQVLICVKCIVKFSSAQLSHYKKATHTHSLVHYTAGKKKNTFFSPLPFRVDLALLLNSLTFTILLSFSCALPLSCRLPPLLRPQSRAR